MITVSIFLYLHRMCHSFRTFFATQKFVNFKVYTKYLIISGNSLSMQLLYIMSALHLSVNYTVNCNNIWLHFIHYTLNTVSYYILMINKSILYNTIQVAPTRYTTVTWPCYYYKSNSTTQLVIKVMYCLQLCLCIGFHI